MSSVFDPSASWIPKQLKKPVKEALDAGWTPADKRLGGGGWFIYSPKRTEKFCVPTTCKDPDNVAKRLRAQISDAYIKEGSAFEPNVGDNRLAVGVMSGLAHRAILEGATIIPGPDPIIRCPVCDDEFTGWDAFANHQEKCDAVAKAASAAKPVDERARVVALRTEGKTYSEIAEVVSLPRHEVAAIVASLNGDLPAKQPKAVPKEGGSAVRPSEGVPQSATDSTEPGHSGTISTKEETPLATESTTPTPKPGPKQAPKPEAKPRKGGYSWTQVNGRGNPLHEIMYESVRMNRRFNGETDSKYAKRLADYIEGEGLLGKLPDADPDVQAAFVLGQIRELLGVGEVQASEEDAETIKQLEVSVAEKDVEIAALNKKVGDLRGVLSTLSDLAKETDK